MLCLKVSRADGRREMSKTSSSLSAQTSECFRVLASGIWHEPGDSNFFETLSREHIKL